uniref:Uncharacterized protein n=1 Tax=Cyanothece sp. (strain PCC 7425 / ATCC 29141) TaxID=395961 RepID=B8HTY2_CYAP4
MDMPNLMPQQTQPIHRTTTGQLPAELAELSEESLTHSSSVLPSIPSLCCICDTNVCVLICVVL